MGTRIEPPIIPPVVPAGDGCSRCWGPGKPFGGVHTPSEILVLVRGMNTGPGWNSAYGDPPEGDYSVAQDPVFPCRFIADVGRWKFAVYWLESSTQTQIILLEPRVLIFATTSNPFCSLLVPNVLTSIFVGGTMRMTFLDIL